MNLWTTPIFPKNTTVDPNAKWLAENSFIPSSTAWLILVEAAMALGSKALSVVSSACGRSWRAVFWRPAFKGISRGSMEL